MDKESDADESDIDESLSNLNNLLDKESDGDESDIDESSSNINNNSSSNDSYSEDYDFDFDSNQFTINFKHTNDEQNYTCDPMLYHLLNDGRIYSHGTDPNKEYHNKKYNDDQTLAMNGFKRNIQSFISEFNIKHYEINNDKHDVINISNNKK